MPVLQIDKLANRQIGQLINWRIMKEEKDNLDNNKEEKEEEELKEEFIETSRNLLSDVGEEIKEAYLSYAMSVIVGRALPDVRDGLKPVHRRVLYSMEKMGNTPEKAYKKSARIVGDIIGKYHPHGDIAVYDTIVRMAQDFSYRYPLVDGQGNFGSIDGDSAAAQRYTEIRMSKISQELLADIDKETIDFAPNYDNSLKRAEKFLPVKSSSTFTQWFFGNCRRNGHQYPSA